MIKSGDYVFVRCLVTSAMPLGTHSYSTDSPEPDVVDLIPVDNEGNIIKRYENKQLCLFVTDVIEDIK